MNVLVFAALLLLASPAADARERRLEVLSDHVLRPGDMRCGDYFALAGQNLLAFQPEEKQRVYYNLLPKENRKAIVTIDEAAVIPTITMSAGGGGGARMVAVRLSAKDYDAARACLPFQLQRGK
ncbi:MAG: hypothetical protein UY56_C0005G0019 [Parcubacteria group bacterium GW2011_GWA1_50_14]|uniref:Secreted protein n=1 Tax=Candidatus Liptonbacteria bacterium GWB1_49_6 TaxID=1798644 RepID=A0A1G2C4G1_9BACT|nr:MAG: hypothetical protein UY56_C0005G0019 [Parcubacteria group bacterium GW2011_GWA1_50_14]OGY96313.1 MAG: hypothetical protein A2122_00740 [Candidatus Liptonbacteria bacterium GWB1_49_6]